MISCVRICFQTRRQANSGGWFQGVGKSCRPPSRLTDEAHGMSSSDLKVLVEHALAEDVGQGDVTTDATVAEEARAAAGIVQKAPGTIYGLDAAEAVCTQLDPDARCERLVAEGVWREGGPVLKVEGSARALLTGERTALNFLA